VIPALLLMMAPAVTFHADVEPILQRRCQTCHRPGEIGPISMMTYQEVRPYAKAIRQAVKSKKMPPWSVALGGPFANHPELTEAEIGTIDAWVEAGAKEGNRRHAAPPARWTLGWSMPQPGMVLTAPAAFDVPARGGVENQTLILPPYLLEDRWVSAAEIRPGSRSVVHHIVAYIREPGSEWLKAAPRGQYFPSSGATTAEVLAVYTPGQSPFQAPAGMAKKIPAGSDLVLEYHYITYGTAEKDQASIGLTFTTKAPEKRILTLQLNQTASGQGASVTGRLQDDALLLSLFPHLHVGGRAFEYEIVGGEKLLRVDPYRFNWQMNYVLAAPRLLKKGTRLRATAWYDNPANRGGQSAGETMAGFFDVAVEPGVDRTALFLRER
jgi:hypothetical protein